MARLERLTAKVFADSAPADEIGQFGSALLGTKVLTSDVATIQGLSAYNNGWGSAVISNRNYPTMQEFNGILKVMSYQTAYQMQEGIPEYDSSTTYFKGSVVKVNISGTVQVPDGQGGYVLTSSTDVHFYASLVDNNQGYAVTNTNYWIELKYVKTTGDTMTGALTFDVPLGSAGISGGNPVVINANNIDIGTTPSSNEYLGMMQLNDQNNARMGRVEYGYFPDGSHCIRIVDKDNSSEAEYSIFEVGYDANNNKYCIFPNTKRVDGQWIKANYTITSNTSLNGSTNLTYDLTSLIPKDGYIYEILLSGRVNGSSTTGQYGPLYVISGLMNTSVMLTGNRQATTSGNTFGGCSIIPLGTDRKITITRGTSYYGTIDTLQVASYRRVGMNS